MLLNRRKFILSMAGIVSAPCIVKVDNIMKVFSIDDWNPEIILYRNTFHENEDWKLSVLNSRNILEKFQTLKPISDAARLRLNSDEDIFKLINRDLSSPENVRGCLLTTSRYKRTRLFNFETVIEGV